MRKEAVIIAAMLLAGCSSSGPSSNTGRASTDPASDFKAGQIRLQCGISCSGRWGTQMDTAASLYRQKSWGLLADKVMSVGFGSDLTYFYLAQSAENLGYPAAAKTYYKLAAASTNKCDSLINNCHGLQPTQLSDVKLKTTFAEAKPATVAAPQPVQTAPPQPTTPELATLPGEPAQEAIARFFDGAVNGESLYAKFCVADQMMASDLYAVRSYRILSSNEPLEYKGRVMATAKLRIDSSTKGGMQITKDWFIAVSTETRYGQNNWCLSRIF